MFMNLHEQHTMVYDKEFITTKLVKKMNDAYKSFKVQYPAVISRQQTKMQTKKLSGTQDQCCKIHRKLPNGSERIKHPSEQRTQSCDSYPPVKEFALSGSLLLGAAIGYFELYNDAYQAQILYL